MPRNASNHSSRNASNDESRRAVGYVRVSTADQAHEGVSLAAQRERISAWCAANGYQLARVFTDAGLSGKRADNRPGLCDALAAASKSGRALVVYSLSRLARSTRDAIEIAERLSKAGADLVSLTERIDTTNAAGKMAFRMLAVLAEFERDLVSERMVAALAHKSRNGERVHSGPSLAGRRSRPGRMLPRLPPPRRLADAPPAVAGKRSALGPVPPVRFKLSLGHCHPSPPSQQGWNDQPGRRGCRSPVVVYSASRLARVSESGLASENTC